MRTVGCFTDGHGRPRTATDGTRWQRVLPVSNAGGGGFQPALRPRHQPPRSLGHRGGLPRPGRGYWLLARRSLARPEEVSYYACYGPRRSSTGDLAWAAGSRWHVEEFQQAKGETGLDHYLVRTWRAWYANVTLSMLALAWLAATRACAAKGEPAPANRA